MFNFQDVNSQQHVEQNSLPESAVYAESVPQPCVDHGSLINRGVLEDTAGGEQPINESCLTRHEGEEENPDPRRQCSCMNCLFLGTQMGIFLPESRPKDLPGVQYYSHACRFRVCRELIRREIAYYMIYELAKHERTHFGNSGDYHCLEEGCKTNTKKFADLRRHYTVRHCTNASKFPCPVFGCKYGGDNGFTREDKLKSHHRNVHQGNVVPGKAFQPIQPKANGANVIESKPQGIQTIKPKPSTGA